MSEKVKVYIGATKGISFISKLIRYYQFGYEYTHAFYVHDIQNLIITEAWHLPLLKGGNVYHKVPIYKNHSPGTYAVIYSVEVEDYQKELIEKFLEEQAGKKYDFLGLLSFPFRNCSLNSKHRWFCSELVYASFLYGKVELLNSVKPCEVDIKTLLSSPLLVKETEFSIT